MTSPTHSSDNRYRAARMAKGLSQDELSSSCGIDARTIRKIEKGRTVSRRTHREVAAALGIDPEYHDVRKSAAEDSAHLVTGPPEASADVDASVSPLEPPRLRRPPFGIGLFEWGLYGVLATIVLATIGGAMVVGRDIGLIREGRVIARVTYEDDGRLLGLVDDLRSSARRVGYEVAVVGRVSGDLGLDPRRMEFVLTPLWCPEGAACSDAMRRSVFDSFARTVREEGGALDVELASTLERS